MSKTVHHIASVREHLQALMNSTEVTRLIQDVTSCLVEWHDTPHAAVPGQAKGLELFPCFKLYFRRHLVELKATIFPNLVSRDWEGLSHLIRLQSQHLNLDFRLYTPHTTFLLSPFHIRFLSILFGRLVLQHLSLTPEAREGLLTYTPYSLEEMVVAGYLQSLEAVPCATIKLDTQDNPYIGSMLHTGADLRRCELPGGLEEEAVVHAWRLFKRLLYYSVEGERLYTGFAFLPTFQPVDYYRKRWPSLLLFDERHQVSLQDGLQAIKQFLLNANGRTTFLALHGRRIVGLLHLGQGVYRQLASIRAWRSAFPLATISSRGRINVWVPLKGRQSSQIPLVVLEYRHGHLHIPLFQDIFWQRLERHLAEVCPEGARTRPLPVLKKLLEMIRRSGHGAILLMGLTDEQLAAPDLPMENQVRLTPPTPLTFAWLPHFQGLAKSDGALVFNHRLEAVQFRTRLKAVAPPLPLERDDLGSGMRHQVTREFTACYGNVLGLAISQDGFISLYRQGKLLSRLY
jgi:hypothetical protein